MWLEKGYHGEMGYMENHFEKRLDPTLLVPGAKSVISFLYNYYPEKIQNNAAPKISKYTYGEDYHRVIKDKLYLLMDEFKAEIGGLNYRIFVDSAPVMERQWAALSGLGWIGKNSLLLRQGVGSFFFIANVICDAEFEYDQPVTEHCGTCTACIDACPTQAIVADKVIDANKCISYQTIELKQPVPLADTHGWLYGCDVCQDVCPWNRFSTPHSEPRFEPKNNWLEWETGDWHSLTETEFQSTFGQSAMTRAGFDKIKAALDDK